MPGGITTDEIGGRLSEYCGGSSTTSPSTSVISLWRTTRDWLDGWTGCDSCKRRDDELSDDKPPSDCDFGLAKGRTNGVTLYWPGGRGADGILRSIERGRVRRDCHERRQ